MGDYCLKLVPQYLSIPRPQITSNQKHIQPPLKEMFKEPHLMYSYKILKRQSCWKLYSNDIDYLAREGILFCRCRQIIYKFNFIYAVDLFSFLPVAVT